MATVPVPVPVAVPVPVSPLVVASLAAGGVTATLAAAAWRQRHRPGVVPVAFAVFMFGATVWSVSYALALSTFDPARRELFELPIEVGKLLIAPAWLAFSVGYAGRGDLLTRRALVALLALPVATVALVATNDAHGLLWRDYRIVEVAGAATVAYDPGVWYYLHATYGVVLVAGGIALVLGTWLSGPGGDAYRGQALALAVGSTPPTVALVARTLRVGPLPTVDFTPLALSVTGVAFGYAFVRLELFGFSPAAARLGRRAAIDDVGVGIVVVDADDRVVELNATAESTLGRTTAAARRDPLAALAGDDGPELAAAVAAADDGRPLVDLGPSGDRRTYEVVTSPVASATGDRVGRTVALHDVTDRERRRQRLSVLHRLFRHNLRNELTVVSGYAAMLADSLGDPDAGRAATIEDRAGALASLAETAGAVERMLAARDGPAAPIDVGALARSVVDDADAGDGATPSVAVDDPIPPVRAPRGVLRPVLDELVDNALAHAGPAPTVEVRVAAVDADVAVVVADDGPGIPAGELAALDAGGETDLEHGSGLGLWLVRWGVDALGGDLSFADRPDGGTAVTVRLRAAGADASAGPGQGSDAK